MNVCDFTVAVNRRRRNDNQDGQPEADFFHVTAWRERGELCAKYLAKGKKVCIIGPVSVKTYTGNDGTTRASLEVTADEVEFLSPFGSSGSTTSGNDGFSSVSGSTPSTTSGNDGFSAVETEELPF